MIDAKEIVGGYDGYKIIDRLSFSVHSGEIMGIIGPNGSGKTTLMKMITGLLPIESGSLTINSKPLSTYSQKELAQVIAVLPQATELSFAYLVREAVALGRYPYQKGLFKTLSSHDEQVIEEAMKLTEVYQYANAPIQSLSGGERQRVYLAQALAQEPKLLLLDEPTNHLDVTHQKRLFDHLKNWSHTRKLTVIAIFHDLNIASMYCDRLLLLDQGKIARIGTPTEVLDPSILKQVYKVEFQQLPHPSIPSALVSMLPERYEAKVDQFRSERVHTDDWIKIEFPKALKTFSSAVIGGGTGWKRVFINRCVPQDYDCTDPQVEMEQYLRDRHINPVESIGMMTAVSLQDAAFTERKEEEFALSVMVTAGIGDAVDAAFAERHSSELNKIGTINIWIFVDGELSEEAFVQAMITATEAKVKALIDHKVLDPVTQTLATGTATDSVLIAATQRGKTFPYAGTITALGKAIAKSVYEATMLAIERYQQRKKSDHDFI